MREIKFRVWDKELDRISEPFDLIDTFFIKFLNPTEDIIPMQFAMVKTATRERFEWLQFTGLKDKNGKEIFEGDKVKSLQDFGSDEYPDYREMIEEVYYAGGAFYPICTQPPETFEVIGNIYQNKDLLQ